MIGTSVMKELNRCLVTGYSSAFIFHFVYYLTLEWERNRDSRGKSLFEKVIVALNFQWK